MEAGLEVIALLLGEATDESRGPRTFVEGAQRLVRSPDGTVRLEAVKSAAEFAETARNTGCFKRGKPIRDPATRQVIGYEMEEVFIQRAAAG